MQENKRKNTDHFYKSIYIIYKNYSKQKYQLPNVYKEKSKLDDRMAWQWVETLVEIRGTLGDIRGTTT